MDVMQKVDGYIENRAEELARQKEKGKKIVGIVGFGYVPEELIYAAGAIPQRLLRGGEQGAIDASREYCHNCFSTFHKAQVGYLMKGGDPVYSLPDHLVFEAGDEHSELTGMYVYTYKKTPSTWLGIPGNPDFTDAFPYYLNAVAKLQKELENLTGKKVSEEKLVEYINVYNEIRSVLSKISGLRKLDSPPLSGLDFIRLNHGSFFCDPFEYIELLRSVYDELKNKEESSGELMPRIALFGCPVAVGDYALLELIEEAGGVVVTEELSGSIRCFETRTAVNGNPVESLAGRYFDKKRRDTYCYPWGEQVPSMFTRLAEDFKADGVIWYQLMYMACHGMLGYTIEKRIRKMGLPVINIQSEYDFESRVEAVRTRIETFIEIVKG